MPAARRLLAAAPRLPGGDPLAGLPVGLGLRVRSVPAGGQAWDSGGPAAGHRRRWTGPSRYGTQLPAESESRWPRRRDIRVRHGPSLGHESDSVTSPGRPGPGWHRHRDESESRVTAHAGSYTAAALALPVTLALPGRRWQWAVTVPVTVTVTDGPPRRPWPGLGGGCTASAARCAAGESWFWPGPGEAVKFKLARA